VEDVVEGAPGAELRDEAQAAAAAVEHGALARIEFGERRPHAEISAA
jgi:hypothetical protein